jgi:hypothetical protein
MTNAILGSFLANEAIRCPRSSLVPQGTVRRVRVLIRASKHLFGFWNLRAVLHHRQSTIALTAGRPGRGRECPIHTTVCNG